MAFASTRSLERTASAANCKAWRKILIKIVEKRLNEKEKNTKTYNICIYKERSSEKESGKESGKERQGEEEREICRNRNTNQKAKKKKYVTKNRVRNYVHQIIE